MNNDINGIGDAYFNTLSTGYPVQSLNGSVTRDSRPPPWILSSLSRIRNSAYECHVQSEENIPSERMTMPHAFTFHIIPLLKKFELTTEQEILATLREKFIAWEENLFFAKLGQFIEAKSYMLHNEFNQLNHAGRFPTEAVRIIENSLYEACSRIDKACQILTCSDEENVLGYLSGALNVTQSDVMESAYQYLKGAVSRMRVFLMNCQFYNFSCIQFFEIKEKRQTQGDVSDYPLEIISLAGDPQQRIFINLEKLREKYNDIVPCIRGSLPDKKLVAMILREVAHITNNAKGFFHLPYGEFTGEVMNADDARHYVINRLENWHGSRSPDMLKKIEYMKKHLYRLSDKRLFIEPKTLIDDIKGNEKARADILLTNAATLALYLSDIGSGRAFNAKTS